jgi:hypothetical protein
VCEQLIALTALDLGGVSIGGPKPAKTRTFLESKLQDALDKLDDGKCDSAAGKLEGFKGKIQELATNGEISTSDANQLLNDIDAAINCVNGLYLSYPGFCRPW